MEKSEKAILLLGRLGGSGAATKDCRERLELRRWHAKVSGEAREGVIISRQSKTSIYTIQSSVVYKWPSEVNESKCK